MGEAVRQRCSYFIHKNNSSQLELGYSMDAAKMTTVAGVPEIGVRRRRLFLLPLPLQGHLNPMFQLAEVLYSQGFSITIIQTFFDSSFPAADDHPRFRIAPMFVSLPEGALLEFPMEFLLDLNAAVAEPLVGKLRTLLSSSEKEEEEPVACIITDWVMFAAREAAREVGLTNVVFWTASAACYRFHAAFPALRDKGYFPPPRDQDLESEAAVMEFPILRLKDLPNFPMSKVESTSQMFVELANYVTSSEALVFNTLEALEATDMAKIREDTPPEVPIFPIGPIHKLSPPDTNHSLLPQDRACVEWLDNLHAPPRSVLYVSFGSTARLDKEQLHEMAWGLADSRQHFLWVLRPGSIEATTEDPEELLLPEGFLEETGERGKVVGWAPQQEVLRHPSVGGFWTHCGWNSTMEGLCEGVPMLCSPYLGDQMQNARALEHGWKVGVVVGEAMRMRREEVERKVSKLMAEEEGREMRRRAMDLKAKATISISTDHSEEETGLGGGSSRRHLLQLVDFISSLS